MMDDGWGPEPSRLPASKGAGMVVGEDLVTIPKGTTDIFLKQAQAEAEQGAFAGIIRDEVWIAKREMELALNSAKSIPSPNRTGYVPEAEFVRYAKLAFNGKLGSQLKSEMDDFVREVTVVAVAEDRQTRSLSATVQERIDEEKAKLKEEFDEKIFKERHDNTLHTLRFMRSAFLAILVPLGQMLPDPWKAMGLLPVLAILIINWKPMRELSLKIKELKETTVKPEQ